jgi:HSP20 family molecular chaperone IbpA
MTGIREFGKSTMNAVLERVGRGVSRMQERKPLPHDLLESDDAYLVVFDAPGTTRSDVQVRFVNGEVKVRVDRFRDFHEGFEMRFPGRGLSLDGSVSLPEEASVEADRASATLTDHGTLRVRIPKGDAGEIEVSDESETVVDAAESDDR